MIYTLTLNPSLDYIVAVQAFQTGRVNRTSGERLFAGGKGINVSIVLHHLGMESVALGFIGGFTGLEIERRLAEMGVKTDFIPLESGLSRINVKVRGGSTFGIDGEASVAAEETEINGKGPDIDADSLEKLFQKLEGLAEGDILVLAGSVPASVQRNIYASIMERLAGKGVRIVVDATGEALRSAMPYHPFLVKPNHHELGELFGVELEASQVGTVTEYAGKLREMGAENVLVSLGAGGAVLASEAGENYFAAAPQGRVINSVGAGDSMVAGFLAGYLGRAEKAAGQADGQEGDLYARALTWGVCAGSASAFSEELATRPEIERLLASTV